MSRVRGFAPWNPQAKTRELLVQVQSVLDEYANYLPMTARQVFYRLVGAFDYAKTENAYESLCETLNRARRARLIRFGAIRDDGLTVEGSLTYSDPADFYATTRAAADGYLLERVGGVEVWCEAAGMAPLLYQAIEEFTVPVYSSSGFDSTTVKYHAAVRMSEREEPTTILHVGDFDPSGVALYQAALEDVTALADGLAAPLPTFIRVAVTPEQIEGYSLPSAPAKRHDRRSAWNEGDQTVQVEALPPDVLSKIVHAAVENVIDLDAFEAIKEREQTERESISEAIQGLLDSLPDEDEEGA